MKARKKTYNSIAIDHLGQNLVFLIYSFIFFLRMGDKLKTETRRETFQQNIFTITS